jgi:hypothetical protein
MGLVYDMRRRVTRVRTYLWDKVASARRWIYEKGKGIKSVFAEQYLSETSSVPTVVRHKIHSVEDSRSN